LAKRIYELKKHRRQFTGKFVEVNCATIRGDGAMSALFGHVKGAFTGAMQERPGLLRTAEGGMLFLDEVGELGPDEQAMLLRAVEEKRFLPLGSDKEVRSEFQLIAGRNRDLQLDVAEGRFREDLLARIVVGAQYSLLIAFLSTLLAVSIGTFFGVVAGYMGGWVDTLIARSMDVFLAFPLLVFALALAGVIPSTAFGLSGNSLRIAVLIFVIGFFNWPYMGRIIRGQTLSLREREFVDAARSLGARTPYILFRELLPNLVAPILVYATLLIPTNILFEAALDYLGVGLYVPTPTWGQMLSSAVQNGYYSIDPEFMLVPGLAIFITVMAFNLFGDGLRDALDPKTR